MKNVHESLLVILALFMTHVPTTTHAFTPSSSILATTVKTTVTTTSTTTVTTFTNQRYKNSSANHHSQQLQMLPKETNLENLVISLLSSPDIITTSHDSSTSTISTPSTLPPSSIEGLSPTTNTIVFLIGIVPFLWATYEFWSRIAVGASFGTGKDSIQIRPSTTTLIGQEGNPRKSRGQQVLGDDALIVAYVLFGIAIASVGIAVYSVVSSPEDIVGAVVVTSSSAAVAVASSSLSL